MPATYTFEWRDGRTEETFGHRGYYYIVDDDTLLDFFPSPAWCFGCNQIALCEKLGSETKIRTELAALYDPESDEYQRADEPLIPGMPSMLVSLRERLEIELRFLASRNLPTSCIECGGRNIFHFPDNEWVPHPQTGEEVRMFISGMCSTNYARNFYDIDGHRLDLPPHEVERWMAIRYPK